MIRHIRETGLSKPKLLKGACKSNLETDLEDQDEEGEEGEEEHEFSDDEILEVNPGKGSGSSSSTPSPKTSPSQKASKDSTASIVATPCRRFSRKSSVEMDDVHIVSTGKSRERLKLDELLEKIRALELSKWGP